MADPVPNPTVSVSDSVSPTLAQRIRSKFPSEYDDMDDMTLESKVLAKYPEYSDLPRTKPPAPEHHIGAQPSGVLPWLKNLEGDIRYGSQFTGPGKLLHFLGAQGTNVGAQAGAADTVASPVLGPVRMAQGAANLTSNPLQGAKDLAGGALQTATLPGGFMAPSTGASDAVPAAAEAARAGIYKNIPFLGKMFASKGAAGENFTQVMGAAKDVPVNLQASQDSILKLMDWQRKTQLGPTINKFLNRITSAKQGTLTYGEARDWYTLLGKLSSDDMSKLPPVVQRELGSMVGALKQDIGAAAGTVGKEPQYNQAMQEFATASRRNQAAKVGAKMAVKYAVPAGAAGYIGNKLIGK